MIHRPTGPLIDAIHDTHPLTEADTVDRHRSDLLLSRVLGPAEFERERLAPAAQADRRQKAFFAWFRWRPACDGTEFQVRRRLLHELFHGIRLSGRRYAGTPRRGPTIGFKHADQRRYDAIGKPPRKPKDYMPAAVVGSFKPKPILPRIVSRRYLRYAKRAGRALRF